jgi:negative regulator of flagellin synthesis FlgM
MPSVELSKLQAIKAPRPLATSDRAQPPARPAASGATGVEAGGISLEVGTPVDTASAPVDQGRVREIRAALRDGSYPLVPTKIVDAIIAARVSFEVEPQ